MSDYTIAVSWSGKDALSDSDTAKIISGDDFNTEFTTVQTAVNSKADLNGSATEDFSATTAPVATNSTRVATTAYVLASVYPVGAVYTSIVSTNPGTLFGGTWAAFGAGKVLVGLDSGDTDFDTAEETGGAKTHTLTTSEMPSHTHNVVNTLLADDGPSGGAAAGQTETTITTSATGGGAAHNNLQPYITVYMFKRTA